MFARFGVSFNQALLAHFWEHYSRTSETRDVPPWLSEGAHAGLRLGGTPPEVTAHKTQGVASLKITSESSKQAKHIIKYVIYGLFSQNEDAADLAVWDGLSLANHPSRRLACTPGASGARNLGSTGRVEPRCQTKAPLC